MTLTLERWYPYIGGAVAAAGWFHFGPAMPTEYKEFLAACLTLGSILTGFLATAKTILMGLQGTVIMRDMHRSTYIDVLVSFMGQAIFTAFGFCILTLLGFFVDRGPIYASIWFSVAVIASLAFIRVILLLLKILHFASTEEPRGGAGLAG